jgi:hypothetical protein
VPAGLRHPRPYSALDLPRPRRAAVAFGLLAAAGLSLDVDPQLPWAAGVAAAVLFVAAGAVRTVRDERELISVRRAADALIVHAPTSRDASELVRWRSAELTTRAQRDRLVRELERTLRALDPARLPSALPLRRPEARRSRELLERLQARLAGEQPVAARGILLAQTLLRDPASPLYSDDPDQSIARMTRRVLGALEP